MVRLQFRLRNQNVINYLRQKANGESKSVQAETMTKEDISRLSTKLSLPTLTRGEEKSAVLKGGKPSKAITATAVARPQGPTLLSGQHSQSAPATRNMVTSVMEPLIPPRQSVKTGVLSLLDAPTSRPLAHVPAHIQTEALDTKEGRELIARAPYILPLDATETNRLDFQHYALRQALGGNYAAPINHPQSILDVGTGTARWGIELATVFPHSSIIGLDIMVPHLTTYPRNFAFVHDNVLDGLPFANGTFDFVHQRLLLPALPMQRLHFVLSELVRVAAPMGWIELVEADVNIQSGGSANRKLIEWMVEASHHYGIDPRLGTRVGEFLSMMRLKDIEVRSVSLPVGHWGGRIGRLMAADMVALYQGMKQRILALTSVSSETYDYTCLKMQHEWEYNRCKIVFHIAYGQRK